MKKLFLVFALVAAYGVSMATSGADVNSVNVDQVIVVADMDVANDVEPEKEKAKTKEAKATKSKSTAKAEGCATAKSEGCATKKESSCCSGKTKEKKDDSK